MHELAHRLMRDGEGGEPLLCRRRKLYDRGALDIRKTMSKTLSEWGQGSTDYGRSLQDFAELALNDIDSRTTVIFLGDARSNYGDPGSEIMKKIYERAKWVMWLNPEEKNTWNYADSVMRKFQPYCHQVQVCNSLTHLERIVSSVLRSAT